MKKLLLIIPLFFLCGCEKISLDTPKEDQKPEIEETQSNQEHRLACLKDTEEVIFEAKGERVTKMTQSFYMTFSDLGIVEDMDSEQIQTIIDESLDALYKDLDFVSAKGILEQDRVKIVVEVDYTHANMEQLIEHGFAKEGAKDSLYVSFDQTKKEYKENGYSCRIE